MNIKKFFSMVGLIIILVAAAACADASPEMPQTGPDAVATAVFDQAMQQRVISFLSTELNVPADQIQIGNIQDMEWPDSCLGLGGPAESCAAVITPGYQVNVTVDGQEYVLRTDQLGDALRLEGDAGATE